MQNEPSQKALDAAYRFLAIRAHSRAELKRKLSKKGFLSGEIEAVLDRLAGQGYLNDEEISLRWAQSLVQNKGWGRAKIAAHLMQKGISRQSIEAAQKAVWQEFREEDIAKQALKKHFSASCLKLSPAKAASFLRSRGFSGDIIYSLVKGLEDYDDS